MVSTSFSTSVSLSFPGADIQSNTSKTSTTAGTGSLIGFGGTSKHTWARWR